MALLSKSCVYGLRAIIYVAGADGDRPYVPIREIAAKLKLSFHFLTKILQDLTEARLLKSYRGPTGGVALARPAQEITLLQVVESLEGRELFEECCLGLGGCSDQNPCPLHRAWGRQRAALQKSLAEARLSGLAAAARRGQIRLADA